MASGAEAGGGRATPSGLGIVVLEKRLIFELGQPLSDRGRQSGRARSNESLLMTHPTQLELELAAAAAGNPGRAGTEAPEWRAERARWWFAQMRLVVERAMDWETDAHRPLERGLFPTAGRTPARW